MASALARAYIGGLGIMPPVGSRGETPGQGVRGASPPEADENLRNGTQILHWKLQRIWLNSNTVTNEGLD